MRKVLPLDQIYPEMHRIYTVPRAELPKKFRHRELVDLGKNRQQETNSSCGRSMGMIALKIQGIPYDRNKMSDVVWLRQYLPTHNQGIDPRKLTRGLKDLGIRCREYENATPKKMTKLLRSKKGICVLLIQAPWCTKKDIEKMDAGHYVAASHVDLRRKVVYVHDTGHGSPWGQIKLKHLPTIWYDTSIKKPYRMYRNWMLWVPVTV